MTGLGPYLAASVLLVVAGALKVRNPGDVATALAGAARQPVHRARAVVRFGGAVEAVLGAVAVAHPGPVPAALVALSYAGFGGYVAWLLVTGDPLATCGCLGQPDTPPTRTHVAVNAAFAGAAASLAVAGRGGWLPTLVADHPGAGWPLVLAAGTVAVLAYGVLSPLARVAGVRRLYGAAA